MVDPVLHQAEVVINSYFGLRFGGPNDLTWGSSTDKQWLFFTDDLLSAIYTVGRSSQVPDAVWRWDPVEGTMLPVIHRTDVLVPDGIRVNKNSTLLYVTDTASPLVYGAGIAQILLTRMRLRARRVPRFTPLSSTQMAFLQIAASSALPSEESPMDFIWTT
jgi:sugar lactone lactonase YvrE